MTSGSGKGLRRAVMRCLIGIDNATTVRIAIIVRQLKQFKKKKERKKERKKIGGKRISES